MKIHIVQKGDTLWKIAKKYGVDFEELKKMNSQLSNPDLIMPGMKIKVPSEGVPVKNETKVNFSGKKEMPKSEHPFAKEKPKQVMDVTDTKPKEVPKEKPSVPYVPPVPNIKQPAYPELDINNYYMLNMAMMPQAPQPQLPPKPSNVLPEMMKPAEKPAQKPAEKPAEKPKSVSPANKEEATKDMENKPNMPQQGVMGAYQGGQGPQVFPGGQGGAPYQNPGAVAGAQDQQAPGGPGFPGGDDCYPVSPVMPGPGFGPGFGGPGFGGPGFGGPQIQPYGMPYQQGPGMGMPQQMPFDEDEDDDDDVMGAYMPQQQMQMPYGQQGFGGPGFEGSGFGGPGFGGPGFGGPGFGGPGFGGPGFGGPGFGGAGFGGPGGYPPGCYPMSPPMPGPGFGFQPQVQGAFSGGPNMPQGVAGAWDQGMMNNMPPQVSPAMDKEDCGCGGPGQGSGGMPGQFGQGGQFGGMPGQFGQGGQFGGMPGQFGQGGQFGGMPGQFGQGGQFGGMPGQFGQGGQFGGMPGQFGQGGQFGGMPGQFGQGGQFGGMPGQFSQGGQFGGMPGQFGQGGQFGGDGQFAMPRFDDEDDDD
ncbi:SafA/ExsA family spore coat assembly protein [Peribacillus frigoritolerans]|uniref:SafA/ExsA family spore coat assembly protein n=1 Tax=Peribacillus frigoritolerans TaxID=450367 RepID=UPI002570ADA1|nr:SafA/ExsA family spore coat assembly protein [Peribacillus frigoritolerans]